MKTVLIQIDKPNLNGRIYKNYSFDNIPDSVPLLSDPTNFSTMHGAAENIKFDGKYLVAELRVSDKEILRLLHSNEIVYVTSGLGSIDRHNIVQDFVLLSVFFTHDNSTLKYMNELQFRYDIQRKD